MIRIISANYFASVMDVAVYDFISLRHANFYEDAMLYEMFIEHKYYFRVSPVTSYIHDPRCIDKLTKAQSVNLPTLQNRMIPTQLIV